ncbi:MAG: hypothetical protein ABS941_05445 [Solibacillus sp.]
MLTNIVELSFSSKKNRQAKTTDSLYVYYPVTVVPVKYWSVEQQQLSIISETILKLCKIKQYRIDELMTKLQLPPAWKSILAAEMDDLLLKNLIVKQHDYFEAKDKEVDSTSYEYKEGVMFFDEVRGQFFEYVHEDELLFSYEQTLDLQIDGNTECTKAYYEDVKCDEQMKRAVYNYNEIKKKFFEDGAVIEEVPVENAITKEIRAEKKSFAFTKRAYLPIRLKLEQLFYDEQGTYTPAIAISPFTNEKSALLYSIIENQDQGKLAIEWLIETNQASLEQEMMVSIGQVSILDRVEAGLQGTTVSQAVLEYLQLGEKVLIEAEQGERHNPALRAAYINNYNLAIEAVMQELIETKRTLQAPRHWKQAYEQKTLDKVIETIVYSMGHTLPAAILRNMKKIAQQMIKLEQGQSLHVYGNRDFMALLLLADELEQRQWQKRLIEQAHVLPMYEQLVELRNKTGSHHDETLFQMSPSAYYELLQKTKQQAYAIIQFLEGK